MPSDQPNLLTMGDFQAPVAPASLDDMDIGRQVLLNLALKAAYTVPNFTTDWCVKTLALPTTIMGELLEQLRKDQLLEVLGSSGPLSYQFSITNRGREQAARLLEISGYVGPAPVSLQNYTRMLNWQFTHLPQVNAEQIADALSAFVLPDDVIQVAGLAAKSRRSLFLHGPPGNGKTSIGHMVHDAVEGDLWIPWCLGVGDNIIRVWDPQAHESPTQPIPDKSILNYDRRWTRIRRPFIVVGGELTIEALDLMYSPSMGFYEAPLHFKANGGTFLIDDFGCQRVAPEMILNRWIVPLEKQVDYLTLRTGQQLEVPFRQMLVVSTNLDPDKVMTPAFLRRLGYRVYVGDPTPEAYSLIFMQYAANSELEVPAGLIQNLQKRYVDENRIMRCCEPRDLIERSKDICAYKSVSPKLSPEILDVAWRGYFGTSGPRAEI